MSHREPRDSDSKRHQRSRFDREPSPKRSRRDGKSETERMPSSNITDNQKLKDKLPLDTPLKADPKIESEARKKEADRNKDREHEGKKASFNPAEGPPSRSHFQHDDERGNSAQVGRNSGRDATGDRGWWRDSRDQHKEQTENMNISNDNWRRNNDRAKGSERRKWGHKGFSEIEARDQQARKRPAFRENKIPVEGSGHVDKAHTETRKPTHLDRPAEESGKEEIRRNGRYSDRSQRPFAGDRASNRREPQRSGFISKERFNHDGENFRRGDRSGGRPGFQSGGARVDKWKHDLYQESNKSPNPKNEEDQIARVEALLSS